MRRIALTGGIASGKSFVADELERLGAVIIDSDVLARVVVEPGTPGLRKIRERFGASILREDGTLDRAALGELVFADDAAREDLNAIVHPLVRDEAEQRTAQAPEGAVVIQVIPLLVETGLHESFDGVIVVDVPTETQVRRLMHRNDVDLTAARARVRAQASRQERLAVADWVIDNSADQAATVRQVEELWPQLVRFAGVVD
ncbi:MAG TPA: dephospho-CoA kinase [Tessaracoccus flavescens]|uniref:Dephospho-CoA kinase n=1 Tax=Tessaracoccus flavescens TaxID=399497 RepID=A0A921JQC4_9ACTN|nr:dephospho-CoA kinase [Tessaracoccus flavescens]